MTRQKKSGKRTTRSTRTKEGRQNPEAPGPRSADRSPKRLASSKAGESRPQPEDVARSTGSDRNEDWTPPVELEAAAELEAALPSVAERARRTAASMTGEEEPGGTVAVPEHDSVDEWASALGVEQPADAPVRASAELLDERDRHRGAREG